MNNERINKLIDTPFDRINPVNYDEVITELQGRLQMAEKVIKSCAYDFETGFVFGGVIVDGPPQSFITSYKALKKYQEGDV